MNEDYEKLYNKIMKLLSRKKFEAQGDEISLYDLIDCLNLYIGGYNAVLIDHVEELKQQINKNNGYCALTPKCIDKQIPRIFNIVSYTTKDNNCYVKLIFKDKKGNTSNIMLSNINDNIYVVSSSFTPQITEKIIKENYIKLNVLLMTLVSFNNENPYIEYEFNPKSKNKYNQLITDGFIGCSINMNHLKDSSIYFEQPLDHNLANLFSKKYGHLDDYIVFYKEEVMKKTAVNINDLNPLLKSIVKKMMYEKTLELK